jgi:hypothetical protein
VLAGRDLEAGGTWLGVSRAAAFCRPDQLSRRWRDSARGTVARRACGRFPRQPRDAGSVPRGARGPGWRVQRLQPLRRRRRPALATTATVAHGQVRWLLPGIYGLSNHLLDTPWPKLASAKAAFAAALRTLPLSRSVLDPARRPGGRSRFAPAGHRCTARMGTHPLGGLRLLGELRHARIDTADQTARWPVTLHERSYGAAQRPIGEVCTSFQSSLILTERVGGYELEKLDDVGVAHANAADRPRAGPSAPYRDYRGCRCSGAWYRRAETVASRLATGQPEDSRENPVALREALGQFSASGFPTWAGAPMNTVFAAAARRSWRGSDACHAACKNCHSVRPHRVSPSTPE